MGIKVSGKPISKTDNLVIQELKNDLLIYDLDTHKAYSLNQTAGFVWQNSDGSNGVGDIASALAKKLNQPVKEDVVWLALEGLKKEGLVDSELEVPHQLQGLNRREVIKKIGLASMVTLPMIASLVAPTAAHAQSEFAPVPPEGCDPSNPNRPPNKTANGGECRGNGNCCSRTCCQTAGGDSGICRPEGTFPCQKMDFD